MVGDDERDAAVIMRPTPQIRHGPLVLQECVGSRQSEGKDHSWFDQLDLLLKVWLAGIRFLLKRLPVVRRSALEDVTDVDVFALDLHSFEDLGQQLTCSANEGQALGIFISAWSFTNDHEIGIRIPTPKDKVCSCCP